tara:strand:- start:122 stop:1402 length:1281 start_codon:yes stop_codon:yes gene_type:complete
MKTLVKILCLCLFSFSFGQEIEWSQTFGGVDRDRGYCGQQTIDGGYIITGYKYIYGRGFDVCLIKTDQDGNEEWVRTFGNEGYDVGRSVVQTTDGGFVITGEIQTGTGQDVLLIKTDENGNELWNKTFFINYSDTPLSVKQTIDGGYILTGTTHVSDENHHDILLIKTDQDGNEEWVKTFGHQGHDGGNSVIQTNDGNYIITGIYYSENSLIKIDNNGNELWFQTYDGGSGQSVQQTTDGGFIITGSSHDSDVYLIKTDSDGNEQWDQTFGESEEETGYSVQQTTDGGYIITGYTKSYGNGDQDVWLIKTDENGNEEWDETYGGSGLDQGKSVQQTTDGGFIITGLTSSFGNGDWDIWLLKISSTFECSDQIGDINEDQIVNILDIVTLVNCVLSSDDSCSECSDINEDGIVNVLDVVILVNIILD